MPNGIIGFNAVMGSNRDNAVAWARRTQAHTCVVMGDPELAQRLINDGVRVVYRHAVDEDNIHNSKDPREHARSQHVIAPVGAWLHGGNEPKADATNPEGVADLIRLRDWTLAFIDECHKLGRKCVIFNFAIGHPIGTPAQIRQAWTILKPAITLANRGGSALGLHEGIVQAARADFEPFVLGRWLPYTDIIGNIPIILTEFAYAPVNSANVVDAWDGYRGNFSIGGGEYGRRLEDVCARFYYPHNVVVCIFCYSAGNSSWWTFNIADDEAFTQSAVNINRKYTVSNNPTAPIPNAGSYISGDAVMTFSTTNAYNVRNSPSTSGLVIGSLRNGDIIDGYYANVITYGAYSLGGVTSDKWRKVKINGVDGYVANAGILSINPVELEPEPETPPIGALLTSDEVQQLIDLTTAKQDALNDLVAYLEEEKEIYQRVLTRLNS